MPQTLQCPRCKSAVAVADDAGGSRIVCPQCQQSFLVPGFSSGDGRDDDDWLALKEPPKLNQPVETDTVIELPPLENLSPSGAEEVAGDDWLNVDTSLAPAKPRPTVNDPFAGGELDDWGTKPPPPGSSVRSFPGAAATTPANAVKTSATLIQPTAEGGIGSGLAPAQAISIEYESEFMIRCPVCSSQVGVSAKQSGKQVRCRDCHSTLQVPPPPRKKKKVVIDLDSAPTLQFSESAVIRDDRPADPFRRSAADLLAAATRVEEESPPPNFDVPKVRDWIGSVFGIFRQLSVVVHWLILSAFASIVAFIALALDHQILVMALFPLGIFFAAMVLACGFTIMQSIANNEEEVSDWPVTLEPTEWLAPMVFCFAATGLACGPGWFVGQMAFGPGLAAVFVTMVSIFFVFPFVLLSMLDMQNILMPFSPEVGRSVTRCEEAWGGFYFSSLLLFFATFMWFIVASWGEPPMTAVLATPVAVAATFTYFAMLGRLAFAIGQNINEAPMVNDIDSIRQQERLNR